MSCKFCYILMKINNLSTISKLTTFFNIVITGWTWATNYSSTKDNFYKTSGCEVHIIGFSKYIQFIFNKKVYDMLYAIYLLLFANRINGDDKYYKLLNLIFSGHFRNTMNIHKNLMCNNYTTTITRCCTYFKLYERQFSLLLLTEDYFSQLGVPS